MMKYLVIISAFFISLNASAQGINFFEGSIDALKAEAAKNNKIIFIDCYTSWCGPCKWLAKNVFTNTQVGKYYNSHFINYSLDMEKGEGKNIQKQYNILAYPTLLFIDARGEVQHRYVGACDTTTFIAVGKQALDTTNNFGSLLRKYQRGERNPDFLAKYALNCISVYYPYDIQEYFATQADSQLISPVNFEIMKRYHINVSSKEYQYVISHIDTFIKKYKFYNIYDFVTSTMTRTLYSQSSGKGFNLEKQIDTYLQPIQSKEKEFWKNAFFMDYYAYYKTRNEQAFLEHASVLLKLAQEQFHPYLEYVITIVTNFASEISDTLLLKEFIDIINPYIILFSAESQLNMANVYINLQNKMAAEEMLNKAKIHIQNDEMQKKYNELVSKCKLLK